MPMTIEEVIEKYPIGSKLVGKQLGFGYNNSYKVCKVIGYSYLTYEILVYNPEIDGHSGGNTCFDGESLIDESELHGKYGKHCWYINSETLSGY